MDLNLSLDTKIDFKNVVKCYKYFNFNPNIMSNKVIKYFLRYL